MFYRFSPGEVPPRCHLSPIMISPDDWHLSPCPVHIVRVEPNFGTLFPLCQLSVVYIFQPKISHTPSLPIRLYQSITNQFTYHNPIFPFEQFSEERDPCVAIVEIDALSSPLSISPEKKEELVTREGFSPLDTKAHFKTISQRIRNASQNPAAGKYYSHTSKRQSRNSSKWFSPRVLQPR